MRLIKDQSTELDAEFMIAEAGDGRLEITIESGGGLTAAGRRRNPDYRLLLEELLRRLAEIDSVIHDVYVASRTTASLPLSDRRIWVPDRPFPIALDSGEDFDRLRKDLTGPQANIGRSSWARSKRGRVQPRVMLTSRASTPADENDKQPTRARFATEAGQVSIGA